MREAEWDLEARWKGPLGERERELLKQWSAALSAVSRSDLKIGKERSRLRLVFEREAILAEAKRQIGEVKVLMEKDEELVRSGAAEAVEELRAANPEGARGELLRTYESLLRKELSDQAAGALRKILPNASALSIEIAEQKEEALGAPLE